ncbi:MAG: DUF4011 domain-containing protein [Methanosphaera sp.]|nr:DUF4011 domain-containing protein [Methanosphaera sp.]
MEEQSNLDFNSVFNSLQQNLLDMGLRNNLLNFKENARTVHVTNSQMMDLYESLVINRQKIVFAPKKKSGDEEASLDDYVFTDTKNTLMLETSHTEKELQKKLLSLFQYYKSSISDQGYNTLFIALGFVEWKQAHEKSTHKAPLILVPVEITRRSVSSPFIVKWSNEDISLNLSLKHKLHDLGVDFPIREKIKSRNDIFEYVGDVKRSIANKRGWNVLEEVDLSTFSFKKFVMFKDLSVENWSNQINNSEIGRLFGLSTVDKFDRFDVENIDKELDPINTYNVMDADSSQIAVIEDAKKGHSLVVEGPPGTGKSQTIVNLISELLANQKSILFVSEKMAALDVVKKRMDSIGLGNYCLELHSNKTRKKALLDDLSKSLLQDTTKVKDYEDYDKLKQSRDYLDSYMHLIRTTYGDTNLSVYDLIGIYEHNYQQLEKLGQRVYKFKLPNLKGHDPIKRGELMSNIDRIAEIYKQIQPIKKNPWNYTDIDYISPDNIDNIRFKAFEIDTHMNTIEEKISLFNKQVDFSTPRTMGDISKFIQQAKLLLSKSDCNEDKQLLNQIVSAVYEYQNTYNNNIDVTKININPIKERLDELLIQANSLNISLEIMSQPNVPELLSTFKESLRLIYDSPVHRALNDPEIQQKFYSFKAGKNSFTKFLNKDYKKAKKELLGYYSYDVDDETITEDFDNILLWNDQLISIRNKILPFTSFNMLTDEKIIFELEKLTKIFDEISTINVKVAKFFNREYFPRLDDLEYHVNLLYNQKKVKTFIDKHDILARKYFKSWDNVNSDYLSIKVENENIGKFISQTSTSNISLENLNVYELESLVNVLEKCYDEILEDYNYLNSILHFTGKLSGKNLNSLKIDEFNNSIQNISHNISSLSNWSQFNTHCKLYEDEYTKDLLKLIKKDQIKAEAIVLLYEYNFANNILIDVFDDNEILKNFNSNIYEKNIEIFKRLDTETIKLNRYRVKQKLDEKRPDVSSSIIPTSQLGILVHEMNKKRNHKSIRQLLNECPEPIINIKPCFLMSPLSIAQYLDSKTYESFFDYVIFDEASQVKIEDSIGALLRGKHYIIMGDTKQLPPTIFFDVETNIDTDEQEEVGVQDVESILHFCKTVLPYRMLKCHYRSRHESLIAVSNLEFYNNDLIVYPSPVIDSNELGLKLVYNPNNIYDKGKTRQNKQEAKEVVEYACNHFAKYKSTKSLGIGTFSVAQKQAILDELEKKLQKNPELEQYFYAEGEKAFFVKNIETIQGDERDVMLISIGYGFDNNHNLSSSFGPLNNEGGERRLNVLTTRAKEKCVVFSNFKSSDMRINARTPKGVKVLKTYLYYAEKGKFPSSYNDDEDFDSEFEESVYDFLIDEGYNVAKQVGCAGYRIDLAIIDNNNPDEYIIGIECDGASYHTSPSARDRDRIRQSILEGLGWKFCRVWSTEWYHNRENAKMHLLYAIGDALKSRPIVNVSDDTITPEINSDDELEENFVESTPIKENISEDEDWKDIFEDNTEDQQNDYPDIRDLRPGFKDTVQKKVKAQKNVKSAEQDEKSTDNEELNSEKLESEDFKQSKDVQEIDDIPEIEDSQEIEDTPEMEDTFEIEKNELKNEEKPVIKKKPVIKQEQKIKKSSGNEEEKEREEELKTKEVPNEKPIESKIQVQKVEVKENATESNYNYFNKEIDCDDFYELSESSVIENIQEIIQMEAPVHREEIYNRLKKSYNVKATKKFKNTVDSYISSLLQSSNDVYVKNNYYYIFKRDIVVRKRVKPNVDYISDDEIIEAIKQVLVLNNNVKTKELAKKVSKLFGFKSLSQKTANKLNEVISFLRFSDKLEINSEGVVILKED